MTTRRLVFSSIPDGWTRQSASSWKHDTGWEAVENIKGWRVLDADRRPIAGVFPTWQRALVAADNARALRARQEVA